MGSRRAWVQTIATACKTLWPDCKVRVFGSFSTGLSLPNGDVDVAVLGVGCKPATAMKILAEDMLSRGEISWLELIESAKVPVCKIRSQSCGLRADVVFNQPDGIETSKFIRDRMKEFPMMRPLLIFMKYFLLQRGLHETYYGGMGSYLLCNVVLHFLQRHPARKDRHIYQSTSLGHYLYDLLKYYGQDFKYETMGISVNDGGWTFNREERGHASKAKGKGKDKGKGKGPTLCLESPSNPEIDLGGACFRFAVVRNLMHHGFHCICHLLVSRAPPEASLLCPLLIDPAHPVITSRYNLMAEQPIALPGLRAAEKAAQFGADSAEVADEPPGKKARTDGASEDDQGNSPDGADDDDEEDGLDNGALNWVEDANDAIAA